MLMRLKELQSFLKGKNIGFSLISSEDANFKYFNGFNDLMGCLVISKNDAFIVSSPLDINAAKSNSRIKKIYPVKRTLTSAIKIKSKTIGINKDNITLNRYKQFKKCFKKAKFIDISNILSELRSKKTNEEISRIKYACRIVDKILFRLAKELSRTKSEIGIASFIKKEIKKYNCEEAFPTIVASGKNSSHIHHIPTKTKLNGFTIIDIGVKYKNYCSDVSRTFYIGTPSKKDIVDYSRVFNIINNIKTTKDINKIKLLKNQVHSLGHSIGLEVHEKPTIIQKTKLSNGMVVAIEPASYYKSYGIRIEDTFLIKNNKLINLNKFPRNLIIRH